MKNIKRVVSVVCVLAMLFSLAACGKKESVVTADGTDEEEPVLLGGWQKAEDGTVTEELQAIFDKAMEGFTGVQYTPLELLETQVVAGMNYRFRCEAQTVVPGAEKREAIVTIYQDLEGNAEITDVQEAE